MWDLIRDSTFGQCLRLASSRKLARYPEEQPGFQMPTGYLDSSQKHDPSSSLNGEPDGDAENANRIASIPVIGWYSEDDPDNPHNWSFVKKLWVAMLLFVYTFSVYIGSSLYTASTPDIMEIYGVGKIVASLGLTIYVLAYGLGPMLFSPLSEIPAVGRTLPYTTTYFVFVILCVPMALVDNIAGIIVLRFLLGFFGSPCLATAGASYGDIYGATELPYVIALWGGGATLGPVSSESYKVSRLLTVFTRHSVHLLPDLPLRRWVGAGAPGNYSGYLLQQWSSCSSLCPRHRPITFYYVEPNACALKQVVKISSPSPRYFNQK